MKIGNLVSKTEELEAVTFAHPTRRFIGFALLLAWHYNLWFLTDSFVGAALLDDAVTYAWLVALCAAAITFFGAALTLGREHHLCDVKHLHWFLTAAASIATLALTLLGFTFPTDMIAYLLAVVVGVTNALLWIMWGELYARTKTSFSVARIGSVIGAVMLICSLVCIVLPTGIASVFIALLPVAACLQFKQGLKDADGKPYPTLLPKTTADKAARPMLVVCITSFVAAVACYYLVAIIPWEDLPGADYAFTFGSMGGAVLLCGIGLVSKLSKERLNIYRVLPWLLVLVTVAFGLFLAEEWLYSPSFFLALAVVAILEVLLVMYFGVLGMKGYVTVGYAFGLSGAFIRLGIATGNGIALCYEANPQFAAIATDPTAIIFICLLAAVIIPLVRQEYQIGKLMAPPANESSQERRIKEMAAEFSFSARETEIVGLIGRGFTTDNVAKKLVISPYTVNTHIRHVYEKMGIHRRSELIDYINRQGDDM